jgi:hypothetical protein
MIGEFGMLNVYLKGKPKNLKGDELWDVLKFIDKELGLGRYKSLMVELDFQKNFEERTGYFGWAAFTDDHVKPREFNIEMRSDASRHMTIKTLIHEFAHIKQWASDTMRERAQGTLFKKGKKFHGHKGPYRKSPWEIDAEAKETLLYAKYKKHKECDDDFNKLKGKRMSKTVSKTEKLLSVMSDGKGLTSDQIQRKVGYGSSSAVTGAIRSLRSQGNCIYRNETNAGKVTYRLGNPGRTIVRTAYEANGSDIFRG